MLLQFYTLNSFHKQYLCQNALTLEEWTASATTGVPPSGFTSPQGAGNPPTFSGFTATRCLGYTNKAHLRGLWGPHEVGLGRTQSSHFNGGTQSSRLKGGNPPKFAAWGFPKPQLLWERRCSLQRAALRNALLFAAHLRGL